MTNLNVSNNKIIIEIESSDPIGELLCLQSAFDRHIASENAKEDRTGREKEITNKFISLAQQTEQYCVDQIKNQSL